MAAAAVMCGHAEAKTMVINVRPSDGDATSAIRSAIEKAARQKGKNQVVIRFQEGGVYNISRSKSTPVLYYVSNTTSEQENAMPVKHVGMLLKDMHDVIIDGNGATLMTHGEMTPWVLDNCSNVTITNLAIDAADPSVAEMTVEQTDSLSFTARVNKRSKYAIENGKLHWTGEGWDFTDGIAQIYYPETKETLRSGSPVADAIFVEEIEPGLLRFNLGKRPEARPGETYQMRHSLRTEVAGLITGCSDVKLSDIKFHFMGNFGVVSQTSENITITGVTCQPDPQSGRTNTGFADFFQVSGCRGLVSFSDCTFAGSHDDPINVHGTHLRVSDWGDGRNITLEYMHHQTFGFQSFFYNDTIEVVDPLTLLPAATAIVRSAKMTDPRHIVLQLDRELQPEVRAIKNAVIENITWTPEVKITGCKFMLTPTRGILVTTRRPVLIADNEFYRCPMASVLIADDARSWYESGPVNGVTIRDNNFIDCAFPAIQVAPENARYEGPVHRNISITGNRFEMSSSGRNRPVFDIKAVDSLVIRDNSINAPSHYPFTVTLTDCTNAIVNE